MERRPDLSPEQFNKLIFHITFNKLKPLQCKLLNQCWIEDHVRSIFVSRADNFADLYVFLEEIIIKKLSYHK
ncbi:hypothetical protein Ddc_20714 [Ditylenchus destructor]|nr:hypothetical protein Ddc_20714 [Ditylenchus destructor]